MEEARGEIEFLPDMVLLMIFRYLSFKDLHLAEQVCERWKAVVETCFATIKRLDLTSNCIESDGIRLVKRCGPSLQTLFMSVGAFRNRFHWINYIAEAFPNLKSLSLVYLNIENEDFRTLSMKCRQLKSVSLDTCTFSDEGLGLLLKGLPALQCLKVDYVTWEGDWGECFSNLGCNLEYMSVICWEKEITTAAFSHLFSKCKKVKTLQFSGHCDELFSQWCQENVSVQKLVIRWSPMTKLSFLQISCLSRLEELEFNDCGAVDSDTLIAISRGCNNLRCVKLHFLPKICERGVKSLSGCRNLTEFSSLKCNGVTEASLVELGKCVNLKRIRLRNSWVSNRSCAAILDHCPQLEELHVAHCEEVVEGIVDIAIQAIENRASGVVLHLHIEATGGNQRKKMRTHPLLRVHTDWLQDYFESYELIPF